MAHLVSKYLSEEQKLRKSRRKKGFSIKIYHFYILIVSALDFQNRSPHPVSQLRCETKAMKAASIPSLRVDPDLRMTAESVLNRGEILSAFVETALRAQISYRQTQEDFIARGLASKDEAKRIGVYHSSQDVLERLKSKLESAQTAIRE